MLKSPTNSRAGKASPADYGKASTFPFVLQLPNPLNPREIQVQVHPGIPIRDYFAAMALATCATSAGSGDPGNARDVAWWCYRVADAMLAIRDYGAGPSQFHEDYQDGK